MKFSELVVGDVFLVDHPVLGVEDGIQWLKLYDEEAVPMRDLGTGVVPTYGSVPLRRIMRLAPETDVSRPPPPTREQIRALMDAGVI